MGRISMEIMRLPGSLLSGNQHREIRAYIARDQLLDLQGLVERQNLQWIIMGSKYRPAA